MLQRLDITTEEYFALPYASNSQLKEAQKIMSARDTATTGEVNTSYRFGAALDALLTDPSLVDVSALPDEERVIIMPMYRSLEKNTIYTALFKPDAPSVPMHKRTRERQVVFVDTEFPVAFDEMELTIKAKCKFDWWNKKLNFGGDLKTTDARTEQAFKSAAKWFNYDQQGAWYMDITGSDRFVILAVSKWNFNVFEFHMKRGDKTYTEGRNKYISCLPSWWILYGQNAAE